MKNAVDFKILTPMNYETPARMHYILLKNIKCKVYLLTKFLADNTTTVRFQFTNVNCK